MKALQQCADLGPIKMRLLLAQRRIVPVKVIPLVAFRRKEHRFARLTIGIPAEEKVDPMGAVADDVFYGDPVSVGLHRDRRIELFQAQARVTELYLRNLERRLAKLKREAARYRPYNEDPDAPLISQDLVADINETQDTIARHQKNLLKFKDDEQQIVARFEGDINRFKALKGLD